MFARASSTNQCKLLSLPKHQYERLWTTSIPDTLDTLHLLQSSWVFSALSPKDTAIVLHLLTPVEFPRKSLVAKQGEHGSAMFIIHRGECKLATSVARVGLKESDGYLQSGAPRPSRPDAGERGGGGGGGGRRAPTVVVEVGLIGRGETFGEGQAAATEPVLWANSVVATAHVRLLRLSSHVLHTHLRNAVVHRLAALAATKAQWRQVQAPAAASLSLSRSEGSPADSRFINK